MKKPYKRPNPIISGQTDPTKKETLKRISELHGPTESKLLNEALEIALPKLLKRYPLEQTV